MDLVFISLMGHFDVLVERLKFSAHVNVELRASQDIKVPFRNLLALQAEKG